MAESRGFEPLILLSIPHFEGGSLNQAPTRFLISDAGYSLALDDTLCALARPELTPDGGRRATRTRTTLKE